MRQASLTRQTAETDIRLSLCLDEPGPVQIDTGCGFLDHMLALFAFHSRFALSVSCRGDSQVDFHHSVEDIGICLGQALAQALGNKSGITRYGSMLLPMDEALVLCALDLSGRAFVRFDVSLPAQKVGAFDTELAKEFFLALSRACGMTLHFQLFSGENTHHILEACFKALGRALRQAVSPDSGLSGQVPSSKGAL